MADIGEAGGSSVRTRPLSEPLPTSQTSVDTGRSSTCPVRSSASLLAAGRLTRNDETVEAITTYLSAQQDRGKLAESTATSRRSRLAEYTRVDDQLHGSVSLTRNLNDEDRSSENDRCMAVVGVLKRPALDGSIAAQAPELDLEMYSASPPSL